MLFSVFDTKGGLGMQILLEPISSEISRIWACAVCGSKIYHKNLTTIPQYTCLCGQQHWNAAKVVYGASYKKTITG